MLFQQKPSCLLLFLPLLLLLFPTFVQAELVVNGTTLQNGDFPYTASLPLYNYSCTGLLWPVSFLPGCTLNLTNVVIERTSILLLAPWKSSAEAAGCLVYPDVIPQINNLSTLPCAVVFVSTVSTVGLFDFEPFGIYASSYLASLVPLTLLPSNVGTTLVNSLTALATPQLATLTTEPSPYTVLFASQAFQGYVWFFFSVYFIGLSISGAYVLLSLPLPIHIYPYSLTRVLALCFLAFFCLARVLELGLDPVGSTGVMNALGRIVMAWCGTYTGYLSYCVILFQWVILVQRLKGLVAKTINTGRFAKLGIKVSAAFFPVIILFIGLKPVYPQLQYATIAFEVILALMVIFAIVCFFVFGTSMLKFLKESKATFKNAASALMYHKVAFLTIANDIALFLVLIALIFTLVNQFIPTIAMFWANHAFQDIAYTLFLISLLISLSVKTEREKTSSYPKDSTSGGKDPSDFERSHSSSFRVKRPIKDSVAILYEVPSSSSLGPIAPTDI